MILEGVRGETIHPGPDLDRVIDGVAIGAMEPEHMLERVGPRHARHRPGRPRGRDPTAIVRRRGRAAEAEPPATADAARASSLVRRLPAQRPRCIDAIREADLFATLVAEDTYAVASEVHDLLVKTHPADAGKIERDQGARLASTWSSTGSWRVATERDRLPVRSPGSRPAGRRRSRRPDAG